MRGAAAPLARGDSAGAPSRAPGRERVATLALFLALAGVYAGLSERRPLLDPKYALLQSEALLAHGAWDLGPWFPALRCGAEGRRPQAVEDAAHARGGRAPWQIWCRQGRLVYRYGFGTPLLSLPFVAVARGAGAGVLDASGVYGRQREVRLQSAIAALLAAATGVLLFRLARRELGLAASLLFAAAAALGTTLWSVAALSLWAHTWSALLAAAILLELARWEEGRRRRPVLLGLLAVAAFFVRPTNAILAGAAAVFVLLRHRRAAPALVAVGAAGAAAFALATARVAGQLLPTFVTRVPGLFGNVSPTDTLSGLLVSPLVGLLVFVPVLFAVAGFHVAARPPRRWLPLAILAAVALAGHLLVLARWGGWRGGGPVGPRYFTESVPLFALLALAGWAGLAGRLGARARAYAAASAWALALAGVAAQAAVATRLAGDYGRPREELNVRAARAGDDPVDWSWGDTPYAAIARAVVAGPSGAGALESPRGGRRRR